MQFISTVCVPRQLPVKQVQTVEVAGKRILARGGGGPFAALVKFSKEEL